MRIPTTTRKKIMTKLAFADLNISPEKYVAKTLLNDFFVGLLAVLGGYFFGFSHYFLLFCAGLLLGWIYQKSRLTLKINAKGDFVDSILPDFLDLTAANLKTGMTPDAALLAAAKKEFGSFKDEIYMAGEDMTLGTPLGEAFAKLTHKTKSEKLNKVVNLINTGYESGGKLAELLAQAAKNIKRKQSVESRIRATVSNYIGFIGLIIMFGAPFLFATASFLVDSLTGILSGIEIPSTRAFSLTVSQSAVSNDIIMPFLVIMLITTAILGSFVLGQIKKGKVWEGVRQMPWFIIVSLIIFFLIRIVLTKVFAGS